jgi:TonB family protein
MELTQKTDKYYATAISIAIHGLLLLLFILYKIITPLPPYPEDGGGGLGVELNFGNSADGMGNTNPDLIPSAQKAMAAAPAENDQLLTDETEEDNYVQEVKPKPKKPVKQLKRPEQFPKITKQADPVQEVNKAALYGGKKSASEGNTGIAGNKGKEDGDPFARLYDGKAGKGGDGGKGKGSGGGEGGGDGTGKGTGSGPGISFDLAGRGSVTLPKPRYTSEKSGRVVVNITVDNAGNVIKAVAGGRGTTVQDAELFQQAESAAKKAKFKASTDGAEKQIGTITYNFVRN